MKKGSGLRCLFGDFKRNLRRQMERRRQDSGTSPVCLREPRCLEKSPIGFAIRLHQLEKPPTNLTQPMFHSSLPAEARPHNPQRGCESAHQGRDRAASRNRGRRGHSVQKIRERLRLQINRLLFARRGMACQLTEQPSLQSRLQHLRCIELFQRQAMRGGLNQRRLGHKPDHFASRYRHALFGCAGSDRFKRDMDRGDDEIGQIHGDLNQLTTGQLHPDCFEVGQPAVRLANVLCDGPSQRQIC